MNCELAQQYSQIASKLPESFNGNDHIVLSAKNLPKPPTELTTDQIIIYRYKHHYNDYYQADSLHVYARKHTYRHLGLLTLAVLFHPKPSKVHIELQHPLSDIKHLVIEYEYFSGSYPPGYRTRPHSFSYYPEQVTRFQNEWRHLDPYDLPCLFLTQWQEMAITDEEWANRNTGIGFGSDTGSVRMAELLLNASQPGNDETQISLEGANGIQGVGRMSAEIQLFLPGHLAWTESDWKE